MTRRPRFGRLLVCAVAAFSLAPRLQAQDDLARVRSSYAAADVARIEAVIGEAVADGVPRVLLVEKAVEGVAKGMTADVVVAGIADWANELREAVALLGPGADPTGLAKAAESMTHGVDRDVIVSLARDHPQDFAIMLQTIEDLVHLGVELDDAQEMVTVAAGRGMSGEDVLLIPAVLRRMVRDGSSPVDAASSIRANLRAGRRIVPPPPPFERPPFRDRRPPRLY